MLADRIQSLSGPMTGRPQAGSAGAGVVGQSAVNVAEARVDRTEVQIVSVDDDPMVLRILRSHLHAAGFSPLSIDNGDTALEVINQDTAVVLLDLHLPGKSGMDCLKHIRKHYPDTQVIVLTGSDDVKDAIHAMREGACEYVRKPYDKDELLVFIDKAVANWRMSRENSGLRESLSISIPVDLGPVPPKGDDKLTQSIARISELDSTVLIGGESGTGKSTVARLIHQQGPRGNGPFVAVNCASLPRDLIESELFGHTKGAFTGAVKDRPGRIEVADGGTLFLDEIGDLPLELQPKLLTFLQDRTIQRIGCNEVRKVDVRLIVATHRDLAAMCQANCFRTDLYYRLNVLRIMMPALRDRADEIPNLVQNILVRIAKRQGMQAPRVADDALAALITYPWPGNIRELENVLERALAFSRNRRIAANDLMFDSGMSMMQPAHAHPGGGQLLNEQRFAPAVSSASPQSLRGVSTTHASMPSAPMRGNGESGQQSSDFSALAGMTLDDIERIAIEQTLLACRGNKAKSARMLGISEKSIYNKIKRLSVMVPGITEEELQ
ncbi:MAG: sigma-54-dependent transcriptional regulator [Pirellula sp.]